MKELLSTRDRIITAAFEMFFEKGFSDVTIDDIVRYAGLSHGTFYLYFKNKKDVLFELVKETFDLLYDVGGTMKQEHSYHSLQESIHGFFVMYQSHWKVIRTWKEVAMQDPEFMKMWEALVKQITHRIQQNIESSLRRGLCQHIDHVVAARALSGMIDHYANDSLMKGETIDFDLVSHTLAKIWYYGIYGVKSED